MSLDLHTLPNLWRADSLAVRQGQHAPSGFAQLDAALGGGWPVPALIELLTPQDGIGELTLLLPLLKHLSEARRDSIALWLNPPYALHALALLQQGLDPSRQWICNDLSPRDAAWAMELGLKSGACSLVLCWLKKPSPPVLRRLKLATSTGRTVGILFRPRRAADFPSPASVRIALTAHAPLLHLDLLKVQGRRQTSVIIDVRSRIDLTACP